MALDSTEKNLIRRLAQKSGSDEGIPGLGIGDDAAFLLLSSMEESKLIISTDSVVENVHFRSEWSSYQDIAVKLVERSASDILCKGGHPHWALLNMNISPDFSKKEDQAGLFIDSLCQALKKHNISLIGGDVTRSETNNFCLTVMGNASSFIYRKNPEIKAGDIVVISGLVGATNLFLDAAKNKKTVEEDIQKKYQTPTACWQNQWLVDLGAKASMDQSDSLLEAFNTLASDNNIDMEIHLETLPLIRKEIIKNKNQAAEILKYAEDLAVIAILPASSKGLIGPKNHLFCIGEVKNTAQFGVSYYWQGEVLGKEELPGNLYQHFV